MSGRRKKGWGDLGDDEVLIGEDSGGAKVVKKKRRRKKTKATKKKTTKKVRDDFDLGLDDEDVPLGDEVMKTLEKVLDDVPSAGLDLDLDNPPTEPADEATRVAQRLGIDISTECPVCRTLGECECVEEDRSFQRRIAFDSGEGAPHPTCDRCGLPLTCILIPRAGTQAPFNYSHATPVWGCAHCHGASLATVLVTNTRGR